MIEFAPKSSEDKYGHGADTLGLITEQVVGLDLPKEVVSKWKSLLKSTGVVDHNLDKISDSKVREEFTSRLVAFLGGQNVDFSYNNKLDLAMKNIMNLADGLSNDRKIFLFDALKRVLIVTEKLKTEKGISKFTNLTRLEGQVLIKIFFQFLPPEFADPKNPKCRKLMKVFSRLGRIANSMDTFFDLPQDYMNGETRLKPTVLNRLVLVGAIVADGISFLKEAKLSTKIIKHLFLRTKETIQNNRYKN